MKNPLPPINHGTKTRYPLAGLLLTFNYSSFLDTITNTSMAARGPTYANIFVGFIQEQFFKKFDGTKPRSYCRYVDYSFGLTSCSNEELSYCICKFISSSPLGECPNVQSPFWNKRLYQWQPALH